MNKDANGGILTERAALDWIRRDEPSTISSALLAEGCEIKIRKHLELVLAQAKAGLACESELAAKAAESYIKRLTNRIDAIFPLGKATIRTIEDALRGHCTSLPGDIFFVSSIPGEGEEGFFALLRHINQCGSSNVSLDPASRPGALLDLRRIARLKAPFVYAMTQQLARVFADIGLPNYHSDRLSECIAKYLS